jgi:hypothetical protein
MWRGISAKMDLVRLLLIAVLALRAAGAPVAAEPLCSTGTAAGRTCCMRHQTDTGGDVVGYCGCQAAPEAHADGVVASTPASPHVTIVVVLADPLSAEMLRPPEPGSPVGDAARDGADSSPPRLTGSGFRC